MTGEKQFPVPSARWPVPRSRFSQPHLGSGHRAPGTENGFTLLEVMIALSIMVVIIAATVLTQTSSIASSMRNKNIIIATNLAGNLINQLEMKYDGLDLEKLPKTSSENFKEPNKDFKYTVTIEEVDFSPLTDMITHQAQAEAEKAGKPDSGTDGQTEMVLKVFKDYLKKAVRRMTVTIEWPEGGGTSTQTFSELIVNDDTELNITI